MHTYRIGKSERNGKSSEETIVGIAALILLVACGLASVPAPGRVTSMEPSLSFHRERLHATQIEKLQTRDSKLEEEIRKLSKTLENTRADLASFRQVHDTLITQVGTTTSTVQDLEARLQESKVQAGKLKEYTALQEQLKKERDEAVSQARDAAERIRELTLKLQRAGVYP
ncbi:MAG: hypothetical protein ABFD90_17755 [Phycisphaerales bacterium]